MKEYQKPSVEIIEFKAEEIMSGESGGVGGNTGTSGGNIPIGPGGIPGITPP